MMMIDRYVAREFLRLFGIFILSRAAAVRARRLDRQYRPLHRAGLPYHRVALSYVYQMPLFISWSMPVAH
jgi:lipopolysaccharide export LptBFGC system permease protein LptF